MTDNTIINKKEKKKINWLYSLAINLAVLLFVLAFTEVLYETNDDFAISRMISDGYPYCRFVNYFVCRVLIFIQGFFAKLNIYMLSQIIAGFVSFVIFIKVLLDRRDNSLEIILAVMIAAFFSVDHYSSIQFTKTAAILMTAGLIWAVDNYTHERSVPAFFAAFLMYYVGVAFRARGMFPAIGYAGVFMLVWWVFNHEDVFTKDRLKKEAGLIALILAVLFVPYGIDAVSDKINEGTPELKYAREYQEERAFITDYPLMDFNDNKDAYDAIGISENDIFLMDRWFFDYDGAATLQNMKAINEINRPYVNDSMTITRAVKKTLRESFNSVAERSFSGMHITIVLALAIYMLCANKPRTRWYILMIGGMTVAVYLSIYYMQRPQYRALYLGELSAALWLMYASVIGEKTEKPGRQKIGALILAAAIMVMVPQAKGILNWREDHNINVVESQELLDYWETHPDQFFVVPTTIMGQPPSYTEPMKRPDEPVNATGTGGWETLTPYKMEFLAKSGVYNPVKDLIDDPDKIYVSDYLVPELTEYYNKWYCGENETVDFVKIDETGGIELYNVVRKPK